MGKRANELALTTQASYVIQQIDSLHTPQSLTESKIGSYQRFSDENKREGLFARNVDQVKSDIEYALAKVSKLSGQKASDKTIEKAVQKQGQIDEEMKKLEDELKQLNEGSK